MNYRIPELKTLGYRLLLVYFFYFLTRLLFIYFNKDIVAVDSMATLLKLCFYGLQFDTSAIVYTNGLFILMSLVPWYKTLSNGYQKVLKTVYFVCNGAGLWVNFVEMAYYPFNLKRMTSNVFEVLKNEDNKTALFGVFIQDYFHLLVLLILTIWAWFWLYGKRPVAPAKVTNVLAYALSSIVILLLTILLCVAGARGGDLKKSTRPITLVDAMNRVELPQHADVVLNTTFTLIRTIGSEKFKKQHRYSQEEVLEKIKPFKQYEPFKTDSIPPNVVIIILESMGREYWGALNKSYHIPNYKSYTPFLDSLAAHSLTFSNFFATSRKSIHGMPSVLAGIPSFEVAYTSSPYATQPVTSVVSLANELGYDTSFFHGAPNGSMGFLGFANTLGFDHYYGKKEFNNNEEFDGYWGIWDEPFLQYTKTVLDSKPTPFLSTVFTVSSHNPYVIPEKYEDTFDPGHIPMHRCVQYTDFALKQFFEAAKNSDWFQNTYFVFTADHGNQTYYPFYEEIINRFANLLMIYKPGSTAVGDSKVLGSHLDILPTVAHLLNYDKPFRSWGQSLFSETEDAPFVINLFGSGNYFMMDATYICIYNGKEAIGFYEVGDKNLQRNLIGMRNERMDALERKCALFLQDYFNRVIDRKMSFQNPQP